MKQRTLISAAVTVAVIALLVLSKPSYAVSLTLTPSSSEVNIAYSKYLEFKIDISLETSEQYIPFERVEIEVSGQGETYDYWFSFDGKEKSDGLSVEVLESKLINAYGYGYGYAYGHGYYGYGYGYGYNGYVKASYNVKIDVSNYDVGDYTVTVKVLDKNNNVLAQKSFTFRVKRVYYGGGGGGAYVEEEEVKIVASENEVSITINKVNEEVEVSGDSLKELGIDKMVTLVKEKSSMSVKATRTARISNDTVVYKAFEINVTKGSVENATLYFSVPISWIKENDVVYTTIKLYLKKDNSWVEQPTELLDCHEGYCYYKALVEGIGEFAIAGSKQEYIINIVNITHKEEEKKEVPVNKTEKERKEEKKIERTIPIETVMYAIAIVIALVVATFVITRRMR